MPSLELFCLVSRCSTRAQARLELLHVKCGPPNRNDCVFQVTQKFQYTEQAALEKLLRRERRAPPDSTSPAEWADKRSQLKAAAGRERDANWGALRRRTGDAVSYGDTIQLRHVASGRFLTIQRTAAQLERGSLRVRTFYLRCPMSAARRRLRPSCPHSRCHGLAIPCWGSSYTSSGVGLRARSALPEVYAPANWHAPSFCRSHAARLPPLSLRPDAVQL